MLDNLSEPVLIRAIEDNYVEAWTNFSRVGGELYQDGEIIRISSIIPYIPYNGVFYSNWRNGDIGERIQANISYFKSRNTQMLWAINPSTRPPNLSEHLCSYGFSLVEDLAGMAINLSDLPEDLGLPPKTEIREVDDAKSLRQFVDLVAWKWHLPLEARELFYRINLDIGMSPDNPGRRFLVYQNGVPVAKAFLYCAAGVVGIYGVSTVPQARRQGLGKAITVKALMSARKQGYRVGILHSTKMGLGIYHRLGFKEYCRFYMYALE